LLLGCFYYCKFYSCEDRDHLSINSLQVLCKNYPSEFTSYFHYCRSLRFDDKPDYSYLKRLFRDLFIREGTVKFSEGNCIYYQNFINSSCFCYQIQIRGILNAVIGTGYQFDYVFDWTILKYPQIGSSSRTRVSVWATS